MMQTDIIEKTKQYVKQELNQDSSHDWWHIYRVHALAVKLAEKEGGDLLVIELAALLHDIADWKFNHGDLSIGEKKIILWLNELEVNQETIADVCKIVRSTSFKGLGVPEEALSLEGQIVQDADRLDAMGAIGIGRTFAYGGYKGREMYNPSIAPVQHQTFESYQQSKGTTINHFHEKLLHLKERINTKTGKALAEKRHLFMQTFLEEFLSEWAV